MDLLLLWTEKTSDPRGYSDLWLCWKGKEPPKSCLTGVKHSCFYTGKTFGTEGHAWQPITGNFLQEKIDDKTALPTCILLFRGQKTSLFLCCKQHWLACRLVCCTPLSWSTISQPRWPGAAELSLFFLSAEFCCSSCAPPSVLERSAVYKLSQNGWSSRARLRRQEGDWWYSNLTRLLTWSRFWERNFPLREDHEKWNCLRFSLLALANTKGKLTQTEFVSWHKAVTCSNFCRRKRILLGWTEGACSCAHADLS